MDRSSWEGTYEVTATVTRINAFSTTHKSNPTIHPQIPNPKQHPTQRAWTISRQLWGRCRQMWQAALIIKSQVYAATTAPSISSRKAETRSSPWPRPAIVSCGGMASPLGAPASRVFFFSFPRQENAGAVDALPCPGVRARRRPSGARARALPSPLLPSLQRDRERRD